MTTQIPNQDSEILLTMTNVCKSFPGVKALDNANLTVRSHSVHALMGENGAGKSTLLKCLFGIYSKDEGDILFLGKPVNFKTSKEALENGISMVHQELNLVKQCTVMDNLWLGRYPLKAGFVDHGKMYRDTKAIFEELRQLAKKIQIQKIDANAQGGFIEFASNADLDPMKFLQLIQTEPSVYRFDGPTKFRFSKTFEGHKVRLDFVENLVKGLIQ